MITVIALMIFLTGVCILAVELCYFIPSLFTSAGRRWVSSDTEFFVSMFVLGSAFFVGGGLWLYLNL